MKPKIFEEKLSEKLAFFKEQLSSLRLGSLNVEALGHVRFNVYGAPMVLCEVASLTSFGPTEVLVDPWDKSVLKDVESGLRALPAPGFSVILDGDKIRLKASALTAQRREDLVKEIGRLKEEAKVAIRLLRQEQMRSLDEMEENGEMSGDEKFRQREEVEKLVKKCNESVEFAALAKQKQLSTL